jgi:branched-chain amino acid transport system permease protein
MPLVQVLADGLVVGAMIALGAVGLTLVYAILRFANFAHGELIAWGGYFALSLLTLATGWLGLEAGGIGGLSIGWALLAALAGAMVLTAALGIGLDALLFRSLRRRGGAITLIIASFGAALALRNLIAFLYGPTPTYYSRAIPMALPLLPEEVAAVTGQIRMTPDQLFILGLTAVLVVALHLFLSRSTLGRAMRATAENPDLARLFGIDTRVVIRWTWAIGGMLAAVAGVCFGLTAQVRPQMGFDLLLPLFAAAILGGIGSFHGAVAGGLILGVAESIGVHLIGAEYRQAVAFVVLIAVLIARPAGLFGERD